ncbi:MAG: hypothetical protein ACFFD5_05875 [Candidatus Thorarchaeota archaeon]
MNCERALEILESIKNRQEILTSYEEITDLINNALISEYKGSTLDRNLEAELEHLKDQFNTLSGDLRDLSKELISIQGEYDHLGFISRFVSYIKIGIGNNLKREINELKKLISAKESDLLNIKNNLLNLNDIKKNLEQAVKVNGVKVFLTPFGETMIDEIKARKRYYSRDLKDLREVLRRLDNEFTDLISKVQRMMMGSVFSAIWAVYLINSNNEHLKSSFNAITNSDYNYKNSEKRMMKLSLNFLKDPNIIIPRTNRQVKVIENEMKYAYRSNNPSNEIENKFFAQGLWPSGVNKRTISLLGKIFSAWDSYQTTDIFEGDKYIENLSTLIKTEHYKKLGEPRYDEEVMYSLMILALSPNISSYDYFHNFVKDIPEVAKFYSSIATLFPWDPEETWMILLRAESNILKAQSAKFIPELIEYALLLSMNPQILTIENNLSQDELLRWQHLIIPTVHLFMYSFLEKDLENYIKRRPLAYIISPRYYVHSSLHYHVIG